MREDRLWFSVLGNQASEDFEPKQDSGGRRRVPKGSACAAILQIIFSTHSSICWVDKTERTRRKILLNPVKTKWKAFPN
jgi:hypothetical protein